jgi:hypothetical protein
MAQAEAQLQPKSYIQPQTGRGFQIKGNFGLVASYNV